MGLKEMEVELEKHVWTKNPKNTDSDGLCCPATTKRSDHRSLGLNNSLKNDFKNGLIKYGVILK